MRILVIDDHPDAAEVTAELLRFAGHDTRHATSGEAGLAAAAEFCPEAVVCDLGMPDVTGFDVARRMRQIVPTVRMVAMTGYNDAGRRAFAAAAGFDAYLLKPAAPADIIAAATGTVRSEAQIQEPRP